MNGVPVLVTIDGIGPIAGRMLIEWQEISNLFDGPDNRTAEQRGAWRVEIDEVPERHAEAVWQAVNHLGPASEVRMWGRCEAAHYVGSAFGQYGDPPLNGGSRRLTLLGNGRAERVRS